MKNMEGFEIRDRIGIGLKYLRKCHRRLRS
jgi:hypothetical protein